MNDAFAPSGVITITTDFGHRGPFVGTMKGVLLSQFADVKIVDLTHEAHVHWPAEAGFWLERSYRYFPSGTVHLAVVDPGVGTARSVLVVVGDGHIFMAPDNGLLGGLIERINGTVLKVSDETLSKVSLKSVSATFHGRDVFAPLAGAIAAGELAVSALGDETMDYVPSLIEPPEWRNRELHGVVITTDNFGNLITNIDREFLEPLNAPIVRAGGHEIPVARTYADVGPGDLLALVNSYDVLEIACSEQSAAEHLGLGRGAPVIVVDP